MIMKYTLEMRYADLAFYLGFAEEFFLRYFNAGIGNRTVEGFNEEVTRMCEEAKFCATMYSDNEEEIRIFRDKVDRYKKTMLK